MERIIQKIGRINEYIKIIENIKDECEKRFDTDAVYRGAMLHYLYLLADTSIVLAEMTIKKKNLRTPQSYSEAFDILGDSGVLDPEFAYSFAKIAGFRNFLAHDYDIVDSSIICSKILDSIMDIQTYVQQIKISFSS
ncbi:DUF86 domain-containing protein [Desulfobacula sp.]|uniref:type VII toxin-antitoxin system HepT family RNase toxin n=1 Tax=Desulfobacula sp. TaxID=2593537 RepID=UPI00262AD319|nr:DUF86 domain-containing protein [Desulfobacula sp.]